MNFVYFLILFILCGCSPVKNDMPFSSYDENGIHIEGKTQEEIFNNRDEYSIIFPPGKWLTLSPSDVVSQTITVRNHGLKAETFVFEGESNNGWADFNSLPGPTYLEPDEELTFDLVINVPRSDFSTEREVIDLRAFQDGISVGSTFFAIDIDHTENKTK